MFDAVSFAGGGNRCYWQGGFWKAAAERLDLRPRLVAGVSAGAFAAAYSLLGHGEAVREAVFEACRPGGRNLVWRDLAAGRSPFPVARMYRDLLTIFLGEPAFAWLKQATDFAIALSRPPGWLPAPAAALAGLAGYQIEKKLFQPVHPRFGRALGFSPVFARISEMASADELVEAIYASASVPPIMPLGRHRGLPVVDGGMVDNVPVEPLESVEAAGGRTLVLLTRRYRALPEVANRTYLAPSEVIPVSQFDITNPDGIRFAYELGVKDGRAFARAMGR